MKSRFKRAMRFSAAMFVLSIVGSQALGQSLALDDATPPAQDDSTLVDGASGGGMMPGRAPAAQQQLSDLTLGNFFSDGWNDAYALRQRATGTPDYPLLRVQTNELLRLFRGNFYEQSNLNNATKRNLVNADAFIDWAFNRRFMIELDGAYQWSDARNGSQTSGGNSYIMGRFKLVDTESSECSFFFKVITPNPALSTFDTQFTYGITGFEDLAYWFNLDRVGLYYSFAFDNLAGPAAVGAQRNDVQYDISIAKTITAPDAPVFKNLTLFEENFAQTVLDGPTPGRTYVTMTPGLRFNFGPCECWKMGTANALILGVDLPITSYQPWSETWRLSYIKSF